MDSSWVRITYLCIGLHPRALIIACFFLSSRFEWADPVCSLYYFSTLVYSLKTEAFASNESLVPISVLSFFLAHTNFNIDPCIFGTKFADSGFCSSRADCADLADFLILS